MSAADWSQVRPKCQQYSTSHHRISVFVAWSMGQKEKHSDGETGQPWRFGHALQAVNYAFGRNGILLKCEETPRVEVTRSRPAQGSVWCRVTVTRGKRHSAANWWWRIVISYIRVQLTVNKPLFSSWYLTYVEWKYSTEGPLPWLKESANEP